MLSAVPTTALRTLLLQPDARGQRHYLKLSLDIQVTSTRRSISVASTRNGPAISALLHRLITDPAGAGAARGRRRGDVPATPGRVRDRPGRLSGRLGPREVAVPGSSLPAVSPVSGRTVLAEVVDRSGMTAGDFLPAYARLLLPPALRLPDTGVGLEAHLQNSMPIFVDGVPHRIAFRDFAGPAAAPAPAGRARRRPAAVARLGDRHAGRRTWCGPSSATPRSRRTSASWWCGWPSRTASTRRRAWRSIRDVVDEVYADGDLDPGDRRVPARRRRCRTRRWSGCGSPATATSTCRCANPLHALTDLQPVAATRLRRRCGRDPCAPTSTTPPSPRDRAAARARRAAARHHRCCTR